MKRKPKENCIRMKENEIQKLTSSLIINLITQHLKHLNLKKGIGGKTTRQTKWTDNASQLYVNKLNQV